MIFQVYISMAKTFLKSIYNLNKNFIFSQFTSPPKIERHAPISFSSHKLHKYHQSIFFHPCDDVPIHPLFPYALITHVHFDLVNDKLFPFSPYGLIHKKESIFTLLPLKLGRWKIHCSIGEYRSTGNGIEFDLSSDLYIDDQLSWRSITTVFKRITPSNRIKTHPVVNIPEAGEMLFLTEKMALNYALISHNVDFIHLSKWSARIMGHRSALMHGMWGAARAISSCKLPRSPLEIEVHFKSPMYLPCSVYLTTQKNEHSTSFSLYDPQKNRPYLTGQLINLAKENKLVF